MSKSFIKIVFASLLTIFSVSQATASVEERNLRTETVNLIVTSGSYDLDNALMVVNQLTDDEVASLYSALLNDKIIMAGRNFLIGGGGM